MIGMTAKYELENCYDIKLETVDKLLALKVMMEDVDKELSRNTSRRYRIPLLAIRQTLDECYEILKEHCAIKGFCKNCKYFMNNHVPDELDITDYEDVVCTYHMSDGFTSNDYCSKFEQKEEEE